MTGRIGCRSLAFAAARAPEMLKLSIAYSYGWKAIGTLVYSAPQALEKSKAADRIVRERLDQLGLEV